MTRSFPWETISSESSLTDSIRRLPSGGQRVRSEIFKQKLFSLEKYSKSFPLNGVTVTIHFEVLRKINKWFWGFCRTEELIFKSDLEEILPRLESLISYRVIHDLQLMVDREMIDLKLSHRR